MIKENKSKHQIFKSRMSGNAKLIIIFVACIISLLFIIAFFVFGSSKTDSEMKDAISAAKFEGIEYELSETTKYLENLGAFVNESQELVSTNYLESTMKKEAILDKISETKKIIELLIKNGEDMANRQKNDNTLIKSYLLTLNQSLEESKNELYLMINSDNQNMRNLLDEKVFSLNLLLDNLKEQITVSKDETGSLLSKLRDLVIKNDTAVTELLTVSFADMKEGFELINEEHNQLLIELNELHTIALDTENSNHLDMLDMIEQMELRLITDSSLSLSTLIKYIDDLSDSTYANHLVLLNQMFNDHDAVIMAVCDLKSSVISMMEDNQTELINILDDMKVRLSDENASSLSTLVGHMEKLEADLNEYLTNSFGSVIDEIGSNHSSLIDKMNIIDFGNRENANKNQSDILGALNQMSEQLADGIGYLESATDEAVLGSKNYLSGELSDSIDFLDARLSDVEASNNDTADKNRNDILGTLSFMTQHLADGINYLETANDEIVTDTKDYLGSKINNSVDTLNNRLSDLENKLNSNHNQLFQSVSSGKELLAAALLTKGQTVANNATFRQINDAILAIEQRIEVGNMTGEIEYVYHYHVMSDGANTAVNDSNSLDADTYQNKGGCFHNPVYHAHTGSGNTSCYRFTAHSHTGSNSSRSGCYQGNAMSHSHVSECGYYSEPDYCFSHTCDGNGYAGHGNANSNNGECSQCGHMKHGANYVQNWKTGYRSCTNSLNSNYALSCNNQPLNINSQVSCGMTPSTIIAYSISCGRQWAQIVKATIVW